MNPAHTHLLTRMIESSGETRRFYFLFDRYLTLKYRKKRTSDIKPLLKDAADKLTLSLKAA